MNTQFSPLELTLCLHYHFSMDEHPWVKAHDAPIVEDTIKVLVGLRLVEDHMLDTPRGDGPRLTPTPKLHAFCKMLCSTPLPESGFIDPRTNERVTLP